MLLQDAARTGHRNAGKSVRFDASHATREQVLGTETSRWALIPAPKMACHLFASSAERCADRRAGPDAGLCCPSASCFFIGSCPGFMAEVPGYHLSVHLGKRIDMPTGVTPTGIRLSIARISNNSAFDAPVRLAARYPLATWRRSSLPQALDDYLAGPGPGCAGTTCCGIRPTRPSKCLPAQRWTQKKLTVSMAQ